MVDLRKWPLEAVTLHFLDALRQYRRFKCYASARRGGEHGIARDDFALQEGRLIQQRETVDVVTRNLDRDAVRTGTQMDCKRPLIHTEEAVGSTGWSLAKKFAAEERAIFRRGRQPQRHIAVR